MVCGSGCFCCSCYVFVPFYFEYLCTTICTNVLCTRDVSCCIVEEIVVPMQEGNCVLWTFALNWSKSRSNVHRLMVKCTFFFLFTKLHLVFLSLWGTGAEMLRACMESFRASSETPTWTPGVARDITGLNYYICEFALVSIYLTKLLLEGFKGGWETQSPASRSLSTSAPVWTLNNPSQLTSSVTSVVLPEVRSPACILGTASPSWSCSTQVKRVTGQTNCHTFPNRLKIRDHDAMDSTIGSARPQIVAGVSGKHRPYGSYTVVLLEG